mmetsp:Transcript_3462/g.8231  ORF Transcript_3462/g.8231 Transcript_3462/m.8231 type:complete len:212 (+) Transcript_3462:359-994(+)
MSLFMTRPAAANLLLPFIFAFLFMLQSPRASASSCALASAMIRCASSETSAAEGCSSFESLSLIVSSSVGDGLTSPLAGLDDPPSGSSTSVNVYPAVSSKSTRYIIPTARKTTPVNDDCVATWIGKACTKIWYPTPLIKKLIKNRNQTRRSEGDKTRCIVLSSTGSYHVTLAPVRLAAINISIQYAGFCSDWPKAVLGPNMYTHAMKIPNT